MKKISLILLLFILTPLLTEAALKKGFVYVKDHIPDIRTDLRYYSENNFLGTRVTGYELPRCIISEKACAALKKVESELNRFNMGLKIFDAYRPQRAVNHFVRWAKDLKDIKMKKEYYPYVRKKNLFSRGFIASRSGHSRGSTVDLTIINLKTGEELDMGTGFDYFGSESGAESVKVTFQQRANRILLKNIMQRFGFIPYNKEWWHFTLKNEPFPQTYFDFPVK